MNQRVDYSALRTNQALIILFLLLAFLLDQRWLVGFVALVMVVGTVWPQYGLFKLFYATVLAPAGWIKPDLKPDEAQPHLFAQALGGIFLTGAVIAFLAGAPVVGWALSLIVAALAFVNLFFDFCLGCFFFFQLARVGLRPELPSWRNS
jgi:hypothetical protein